jgi:hypothetical protein
MPANCAVMRPYVVSMCSTYTQRPGDMHCCFQLKAACQQLGHMNGVRWKAGRGLGGNCPPQPRRRKTPLPPSNRSWAVDYGEGYASA